MSPKPGSQKSAEDLFMLSLFKLTHFFPLFQKKHYLCDRDREVWIFEERLDDGTYPRYTLSGHTILSSPAVSKHKANLFAKFTCISKTENLVDVFIEDIVTTKRSVHIGTWMMNRFIEFLRICNHAIKIYRVWGDFCPESEEMTPVLERFFSRHGFNFSIRQYTHGDRVIERRTIIAGIHELHLVPVEDIVEIDIEKLLREYFSRNL